MSCCRPQPVPVNIDSVGCKRLALGPQTASESIPVVVAPDSIVPVVQTGIVSTTNESIGLNYTNTPPTSSTCTGGVVGPDVTWASGQFVPMQMSSGGDLFVQDRRIGVALKSIDAKLEVGKSIDAKLKTGPQEAAQSLAVVLPADTTIGVTQSKDPWIVQSTSGVTAGGYETTMVSGAAAEPAPTYSKDQPAPLSLNYQGALRTNDSVLNAKVKNGKQKVADSVAVTMASDQVAIPVNVVASVAESSSVQGESFIAFVDLVDIAVASTAVEMTVNGGDKVRKFKVTENQVLQISNISVSFPDGSATNLGGRVQVRAAVGPVSPASPLVEAFFVSGESHISRTYSPPLSIRGGKELAIFAQGMERVTAWKGQAIPQAITVTIHGQLITK